MPSVGDTIKIVSAKEAFYFFSSLKTLNYPKSINKALFTEIRSTFLSFSLNNLIFLLEPSEAVGRLSALLEGNSTKVLWG